MPVWLDTHDPFPRVDQALRQPNGLLALGGELTVPRLQRAYAAGIFPWFSEHEPALWWCPDPRMVLRVDEFKPSHSLRKRLRQIERRGDWGVFVDYAFDMVMLSCAQARRGQDGTWISPAIQRAYGEWHRAGQAHSIETWSLNFQGQPHTLLGGLYGVSLGQMFFGESMFTRCNDASKVALSYLVHFLKTHGGRIIDCQQQTQHLEFLGARPISRTAFVQELREAIAKPAFPWQPGRLLMACAD